MTPNKANAISGQPPLLTLCSRPLSIIIIIIIIIIITRALISARQTRGTSRRED